MHEVWLSYSVEPCKWRSVEIYAVDLTFVKDALLTEKKSIVVAWPSGELVAFSCSGSPLCRHLCSGSQHLSNFFRVFNVLKLVNFYSSVSTIK